MTVILVLATIAIFLTIDFIRSRKRTGATATQTANELAGSSRVRPSSVAGFELPDNLRYHPGHTWALQESPTLVRAGLDDFAAKLIGQCHAILLPKRGRWIRQGQRIATVLRDGQKAELVSPIEGEITDVNEGLAKDPSLVCRDPYAGGWLVTVMSPDAQTNFRNLLNGDVARRWMAEAASRLRAKMPVPAGAVAQDGGTAVSDISAHLSDQNWAELTREFFLT
jgi:glycine cleavage system H protein